MATFYRNKNFSGISSLYNNRVNNLGLNNNQFSSIKLTGNSYLVAYDNFNLTGNSIVIIEDIQDLSLYGFDKKIKSIIFYSNRSAANVYSRSYDACCSFNSISASNDIYTCSGFFVTPNGYLVTAAHCVLSDTFNTITKRYDPLVEFHVSVSNVNNVYGVNRVFTARLVGYDQIADIAVLKVDGLTNQQYLSWGKSRQTPIGSRLYILGNPGGVDEDSFSSGIVRDNKYNGEFPLFFVECVLTDATIIGGNSGGPLLNAIGEVIGLSNYGIGSSNQLGGGVSQYVAETIVNRIIQYDLAGRPIRNDYNALNQTLTIPTSHPYIFNDGSCIYGALGAILLQLPKWLVSYIDLNSSLYQGGYVYDVDSSSDLKNYVSADDIIMSIDNEPIGLFKNQITPHSVLMNKLPGNSVTITYYKYSEGYSRLHTNNIIITRYPNSANFDSNIMRDKREELKKSHSIELLEKIKNIKK
jgi:S1-C subfamily serine protease